MSTALVTISKKPFICSVPECGGPHIAKTFCQNHYRVFKRNGTPTPVKAENKIHTTTGGYLFRSVKRKTTYLHIEAAEKVLGKNLPFAAEVHHVNGDNSDNRNANLVICPNHEYHMLLHQREKALLNSGNPSYRACNICGEYDDIKNMKPHGRQFYHRYCKAMQAKERRLRVKQKAVVNK